MPSSNFNSMFLLRRKFHQTNQESEQPLYFKKSLENKNHLNSNCQNQNNQIVKQQFKPQIVNITEKMAKGSELSTFEVFDNKKPENSQNYWMTFYQLSTLESSQHLNCQPSYFQANDDTWINSEYEVNAELTNQKKIAETSE